MPELPEVEVVKRSLEKVLKNLVIKKVKINNNRLRYLINKKEFNKIVNCKIISVERRSKYILLNLKQHFTILIHLGMTGKLFIVNKNKKRQKTSFYYNISANDNKHDHVIIHLNKQLKLIYNDVRKFGFIKIINSSFLMENNHLKHLGPEPLSVKFNFKFFKHYIINKNKNLKNILMDQKFISGLGNIYVNEILFLSRLNPKKSARTLKDHEIIKIIKNTKKILKKSIIFGGSSINDFENTDGKKGNFQQQFNVYSREKLKCLKHGCHDFIKKTYISNRATFFCSSCQK